MLQNDEFTKDLFRFLQLLCEGHNGGEVITVLRLTYNYIKETYTHTYGGLFLS